MFDLTNQKQKTKNKKPILNCSCWCPRQRVISFTSLALILPCHTTCMFNLNNQKQKTKNKKPILRRRIISLCPHSRSREAAPAAYHAITAKDNQKQAAWSSHHHIRKYRQPADTPHPCQDQASVF